MTKPKKPMIRHCFNCEWCERMMGYDKCDVLYVSINNGKRKAKWCKFFTMKEGEADEDSSV